MRCLFLLDPLQLPSAPSYVSLSLQGGFLHDPPHMPGLATLAGHMIFNNPVPFNSPPVSQAQRSSAQEQGEEEKQRRRKKNNREKEKKEREEEKREKKEEGETGDEDSKDVHGGEDDWSAAEERKVKEERKRDGQGTNEGAEKEATGKTFASARQRQKEVKEEEDEGVKKEKEEEEEEFLYYPSLDSFLFANEAAEPLQFSTGEFISSLSYSLPSSVLLQSLDQLHYVLLNPNITEVAVNMGVIQLLQLQQRQVRTRRLEPYWRKTSVLKNHVVRQDGSLSLSLLLSLVLLLLSLHASSSSLFLRARSILLRKRRRMITSAWRVAGRRRRRRRLFVWGVVFSLNDREIDR